MWFFRLSALQVGLKKRYLLLDNDKNFRFCYYEKGLRIPGQSSMIFIHGLFSNKEAWLSLIENIPSGYHCILIDLPGHGETIGSKEDNHILDEIVDKIKSFFDQMNFLEPLYIIGASISGTIFAMFTIKYPQYIHRMCLLSPPPSKDYESSLMQQIQLGMNHVLLPETSEQFYAAADLLTTKKITVPKAFVHRYFKSRLRVLDEQKKLLKSFLENEYLNLEEYYQQLKDIQCPTLILWGREDKLCTVDGAEYFSKLISHSNVIIFDDCGHFISYDKPQETAKNILNFLDLHSYCILE